MVAKVKSGGVYKTIVAAKFKKNGVYSAISALSAKNLGIYSSLMGVVAAPPTGMLRVVSTLNQANNGNATVAGRNTVLLRWPVIIGSGDVSEIVLSNMGWYNTIGGSAGLLNSITIDKIAFEKDGGAISVPVLKNGLRPLTLVALDNDIQYDPILPSQFGMSSFAQGSKYWIRIQISLVAGQSIPTGSGRRTESDAGSQVLWFDSVATTITNGVDGYGAFTTTGTAPTSTQKVGYCPIVLGKFVSGDPPTWFACGDSIINSVGDIATNPNGWGMFQRAIMADGTPAKQLAALNWSMPSSSSPMMGAAYVYYWFKYARFLINNYGANDFGNQGTTITMASMQTKDQLIYTRARAAGVERILRNKLMFRQTSTDTFLTVANQTPGTGAYGAGWDVGGNADLFNQWLETQVGTLIDGLVDMVDWHDPVATTKWVVDGVTASYATGDGVHPAPWLHSALALNRIRPSMDAIAAM